VLLAKPSEEIRACAARRATVCGEPRGEATWKALLDWLDGRFGEPAPAEPVARVPAPEVAPPALDRRLLTTTGRATAPLVCEVCRRPRREPGQPFINTDHCPRTEPLPLCEDRAPLVEHCLQLGIEAREVELAASRRENMAWRAIAEVVNDGGLVGFRFSRGAVIPFGVNIAVRNSKEAWGHGSSWGAAATQVAQKLGLISKESNDAR
jgi:hypothetical protein